jgi:predicted Fe-Mo cluster-binding NifX family protein
MGYQYYMGNLGPEKMSSFIQISQTGQNTTYITKETTGITIYIAIQPKSDVEEIIKDYTSGKAKTGPFSQLN